MLWIAFCVINNLVFYLNTKYLNFPFYVLCVAMSCSDSMEYAACRTGCLEQCGRSQFSPGDMMGDGLMKGNGSVCLNTPTEGCFCPEGSVLMGEECVSKEACSQCVDHHGKTHKVYGLYHLLNIMPLWYCYCHHFIKPISLCQSHDPSVCVSVYGKLESWGKPLSSVCVSGSAAH